MIDLKEAEKEAGEVKAKEKKTYQISERLLAG